MFLRESHIFMVERSMHLLAEHTSDQGSANPPETAEEGKSSKSQGASSRREAD
jgi:hypothetical protein